MQTAIVGMLGAVLIFVQMFVATAAISPSSFGAVANSLPILLLGFAIALSFGAFLGLAAGAAGLAFGRLARLPRVSKALEPTFVGVGGLFASFALIAALSSIFTPVAAALAAMVASAGSLWIGVYVNQRRKRESPPRK